MATKLKIWYAFVKIFSREFSAGSKTIAVVWIRACCIIRHINLLPGLDSSRRDTASPTDLPKKESHISTSFGYIVKNSVSEL